MKNYLVIALCFAMTWGLLPAQADVDKLDFKLSNSQVNNMNDLIYLKARVGELEKENQILKKKLADCKGPSSFGSAYINEEGQLKCKAEDGGQDWDWNGKTWFRAGVSTGVIQSSYIYTPISGNCPTGNCPTVNGRSR